MFKQGSVLDAYFNRQLLSGSWTAGHFPHYLIDNFESRITSSVQIDNLNGDNVPPYACSFSSMPNEYHIVSVADEDGQLRLFNISKPLRQSLISTWNGHSNAVFDTRWLPGERTILTASGDQTLALHDLVTQKRLESFLGHSSSVRTLDLQTNCSDVFSSGSRDGTIRLWDRRISKTMKRRGVNGLSCVHCLTACHQPLVTAAASGCRRNSKSRMRRRASDAEMGGPDKSVTSVAFLNGNEIVSCGSSDGRIKIWDVRKFTSRGTPKPSVVVPYHGESRKSFIGYSHVLVDHVNSRLFAVCRDNVIYQYGMSNPERPQMTYRGHYCPSFYIRASLSPDRRYIVCGSGDCSAYIYQVDNPDWVPVMLRGFESEVTEVKWSPYDPTVIVALSDDCWIRVWRMNRRSPVSTSQSDDFWGLAERCRLSIRSRWEGDEQSQDNAQGGLSGRQVNCPNSPAVRQLNIETFLTTPSSVQRNSTKRRASAAFSLMDPEPVTNLLPVSPKKLVISPRKQSGIANEELSLKRRMSLGDSPATSHLSPVRKRLRFDSSTVLTDIQQFLGHEPSPRKRKIEDAAMKENVKVRRASSPQLPSKKVKRLPTNRVRKSISRRSLDSKKDLRITSFFSQCSP